METFKNHYLKKIIINTTLKILSSNFVAKYINYKIKLSSKTNKTFIFYLNVY